MKKASLIKRGIAWLCDLCTAFLLSCLCLKLFAPPFHWCSLSFIGSITLCYFLLCQLIWKRSFFQYLFGLQVEGNAWKYFVWKISLWIVVPLSCFLLKLPLRMHIWNVLLERFDFEFVCTAFDWIGENNGRLLCALLWLIPLGLAETVCYIVRKRTFAERLGKSKVVQTSESAHPAVSWSIAGLMLLLMAIIPFQHYRLEKEYGFPAYDARPSFPGAPLIEKQRFIRDFQAKGQDAQAYIMGLFDQYDIVFLVEREHPEYTQWDFFSQLILNDTFAERVGCVATEYGRHEQQQQVDAFLSTPYPSDTDRQKEAADIIRNSPAFHPFWFGRNIYDFIIRLQEYDITHDSAHQIRWFPGGGDSDWARLDSDQTINSFYAMEKQHDSSIARTVIHYYNERKAADPSRNKMLVIVNQIHGFRNVLRQYRTTIDLVDEAFPGKVGAVYLPTANFASPFSQPLYNGVWQDAATAVGDCFAVPLKGSLVEKQYYTGLQAPEKFGTIKMDELFDGFLFYKTPYEYYFEENGYPYFWENNFEDSLKRRFIAIRGDSFDTKKFIDAMKAAYEKNEKEPYTTFASYNHIYDTFFLVTYAFMLLCTLLSLWLGRKQVRNVKSEGSNE